MELQKISTRQAFSMLVLFMVGSVAVLAPGREAGRDIWLAITIALILSFPLALLYGRLTQLYPDRNLFDMQLELFGPVLGRITSLIYFLYCLHLGALVIRNFTEYIQVVSFPGYPLFMFAISLGLLAIWCARKGARALGQWSAFVLPVYLVVVIFNVVISLQNASTENLQPVLEQGMQPVLKGAISIVGFPFLEPILLASITKPLENPRNAIRIYIYGFIVTAVVLVMIQVRNTMVLSKDLVATYNFPSYESVALVNIGEFIQGIQALVVLTFLIGGFVKITAVLLAASQSAARMLNFRDYRAMAVPVGLLMATVSIFAAKNLLEMFAFASQVYIYYVLPVGLFIPLLLWIVAEVKSRKGSGSTVQHDIPEQEDPRMAGMANPVQDQNEPTA